MTEAWLIKEYGEDDDWKIVFTEPDRYVYESKKIVFAEVKTFGE